MPYRLKNKILELDIDDPRENYQSSRFDWTGKIIQLKFKGVSFCGAEMPAQSEEQNKGKGFYNEFGMNKALGFEETMIGDWFHKIGVGLLKKDSNSYQFLKDYEIQPAEFQVSAQQDCIEITCISDSIAGYRYKLIKNISLEPNGFTVHYALKNTGDRRIETEEYNHNFIMIGSSMVGSHYQLNLPFQLQPEYFTETTNPDDKVSLKANTIMWKNGLTQPFFFGNLSGGQKNITSWEIIQKKAKLGIREYTNFTSDKMNLWGWKHAICPEIFIKIEVMPGERVQWSRTYEVFEINEPTL